MRKKDFMAIAAGILLIFVTSFANAAAPEGHTSIQSTITYTEYTDEKNFEFSNGVITKYIGTDTEVIIPPSINGISVTAIGEAAFVGANTVTSVTIPYGVTSIGIEAFFECRELVSVEIPNSVIEINEQAFFGCGKLVDLELPESVQVIGRGAFNACMSIKSITIPEGITKIEEDTFFGCSGLLNINISDSVELIGSGAFSECSSLTSIKIPDNITFIADSAFSRCKKLKTIEIPKGVTSIGIRAFYECVNLENITLPDGVTAIGNMAFYKCVNLENIELPNSVTYIGNEAFYKCEKLTDIIINENITNVGNAAFANCTGIRKIYWNAKEISDYPSGRGPFSNSGEANGAEVIIGNQTERIPDYLFESANGTTNIASISIGENVTSIGKGAFKNCGMLKKINIPQKVTAIERETFYGCVSLTDITIPSNIVSVGKNAFLYTGYYNNDDNWSDNALYIDNILINVRNDIILKCKVKPGTKVIAERVFYNSDKLTEVIIPDSILSLGNMVFGYCANLTYVELPNSVESIGQMAFYKCIGLKSIKLPQNIDKIPFFMFGNCSGLESITIPKNVKEIGNYAFYGCTGLKTVYYEGSKAKWESIAIDEEDEFLINADIHFLETSTICLNIKVTEARLRNNILSMSLKTVNSTKNSVSGDLIIAAYDDKGVLKRFEIKKNIRFGAGEGSIMLDFDKGDLSADCYYRIIVWDSAFGMKPLANTCEIR